MSLWTKQELLEALSDQLLEHKISDDLIIDQVVIDSRKNPKSGLFIALKGENNDAHNFLTQAFENGCKALLVHDKSALTKVKNCDFLLVKDTFEALYQLAKFSRQRSLAKIIAVTGSVGKTTTKEMLSLAFSAYGKTFATTGNFNNHIGLPLSLCNFSRDCAFGIFEMGMNHLQEIEPLSRLARPHLAIITNVGPVHIQNFKNEEEIALAKAEIFCGLEPESLVLLNCDNQHFNFLANRAETLGIKQKNILSFGKNAASTYCLKDYQIKALNLSQASVKVKDVAEISYQISTCNKTTIFNSVIIAAALHVLTNDPKIGLTQLEKFLDSAGRGKVTEVIFNNKKVTLIDDSYNASVLSMRSGLEYAAELKSSLNKKRVVAAIGDMLELGEKSAELHEEVAKYLQQLHIDFAVLVGDFMTKAAQKLPKNSYKTFLNSASASLEISDLIQDDDILYIKGSRGTKMEKIIEKLTNQISVH
jgi:UDP-N-acetylmuramoyl-tripeptide--D-alanyl-D-alanine ligase